MELLAITYHYLGDYHLEYPGINSISLQKFQDQVEALAEYFQFVSQDDLLKALENKTPLPKKSCVLTFDDGLRSQYDVAVPILKKMRIPAIFFLCGLPYEKKEALTIHKIHWLRSILHPEIFLQKIVRIFDQMGYEFSKEMISIDKIRDKFFWDDTSTRQIKYLLNVVLPYPICKQCIDLLFAEQVSSESQFCNDFYMSTSQIKDLNKGFDVGVHSYSHRVLGKMDEESVIKEIRRNIDVISTIISEKPRGISYPYGYKEAVTPVVASIAQDLGLSYGFTVERSMNISLEHPFLLARIDTNDAPKGKKPIFNLSNRTFQIENIMTYGRERYFFENQNTESTIFEKKHHG